MRLLIISVALTVMLFCLSAEAQTFEQCADVNGNGIITISDVITMIEIFQGDLPLPSGKGDIDFRQNFNLGDFRFLCGYIFTGYGPGGCPPFAAYNLVNSPDSLFLPKVTVAAGSGTVVMPILYQTHEVVSDLLLTGQLSTTGVTATIESFEFVNWIPQIRNAKIAGNDMIVIWGSANEVDTLTPGARTIAALHVNYSSAAGGTISLEPANFGPYSFIHQVYGDYSPISYSGLDIGVPSVFVSETSGLPQLLVDPDSLIFYSVIGWAEPDTQFVTIDTDGDIFAWTLTHPAWLSVTPTSGFSGSSVKVVPISAGLSVGTHNGDIVVSAFPAYDSPRSVHVQYRLQAQYPSFDANCDGEFTISDIVAMLNYIFAGGAVCDPCAK